jgi:hypothetical protein
MSSDSIPIPPSILSDIYRNCANHAPRHRPEPNGASPAESKALRKLVVGDILGKDVSIPEELERLRGWIVFKIWHDGTPELLEPADSAPADLVSWLDAKNHIKQLRQKGHSSAEFNSGALYDALSNTSVRDKADLVTEGFGIQSAYWEDRIDNSYTVPHFAYVRYLENGWLDSSPIHKKVARVRAIQIAPELIANNP